MGMEVLALFTAALGLKVPWGVKEVTFVASSNRIDFQVACNTKSWQLSLKRYSKLLAQCQT